MRLLPSRRGDLIGFALLIAVLAVFPLVVESSWVNVGVYAMIRTFVAEGTWFDSRESNLLDGGAPYYGTYRCADGKDIAIGAMEPQFWSTLLERIGLADDPVVTQRDDRSSWPRIRETFAAHFATRTRDAWVELTAGTDACLAPVLSLEESLSDPHLVARGAFSEIDGVVHPAPAPRFAGAGMVEPRRPPRVGEHTDEILADLGLRGGEISELRSAGVVA